MVKLTNAQLKRYFRHIILGQVGGIGHKKILDAKILIIGTGELGAPAGEALKYILGIGELLTGYLLTFDALIMTFRKVKIPRNKKFPVCSENPTITELVDYEQLTCSFGA